MRDESLIDALLAKREELQRETLNRTAILSNDIEAIDRVLDACGYRGELEGGAPRQARIVLSCEALCNSAGRRVDGRG